MFVAGTPHVLNPWPRRSPLRGHAFMSLGLLQELCMYLTRGLEEQSSTAKSDCPNVPSPKYVNGLQTNVCMGKVLGGRRANLILTGITL